MSGQTFTTTIRIPTPQELAAIVAEDARNRGIATGSSDTGAQQLTAVHELRDQLVLATLAAAAPVASVVPGTVRERGESGADVEVIVNGARIPMEIDIDPSDRGRATMRMDFAESYGLTCDGEAAATAEVVACLVSAGFNPDRPTAHGATAAAATGRAARRGAS